jgi:hypothetical protein
MKPGVHPSGGTPHSPMPDNVNGQYTVCDLIQVMR